MKILQISLLGCFLLIVPDIFSQIHQIDSLHRLYEKNQYNNLLKAEEFARASVELSKKTDNDSLVLKSNNYLIGVLLKNRKISEAKEKALENVVLGKKIKNKKQLCKSYSYLGYIYRVSKENNKSLAYIEKGLSLAKNYNFNNLEHQLLNYKAILFRRTKNNKKAKQILQSLIKDSINKNTNTLTFSYNSLASLYGRFEKKKDSSVYFYKKGIELVEQTSNSYLKTLLYTNYSNLLFEENREKEGLFYLEKAKSLAEEIKDYSSLFFINNSLASYYAKKEDDKKAIELYEVSLDKYLKYADGNQTADLYWVLSGAYYNNKQYKEGFNIQEKLLFLKDSLFDIEKNKAFEKLQTEYEVEKKEDQIAFLEKEQQLKTKEQKLTYSIGGLLLVASILLIFIYRNKVKSQKIIRKQEQLLYAQEKEQLKQSQKIEQIESYIKGQEQEKNRIAIELHDGVGGELSGIKHFVSSLPTDEKTDQLSKDIASVSKEIRLLAHSLSASFGIQQPFKNLLATLKQRYKNHFKFEISIFPEDEIDTITDEKKLFLYRSIQEMVTNIYKHANASLVSISLTIANEITLIVEDNGTGFNPNTTPNGIGLQNIKEKVNRFNGTFVIDSSLEKGTTIILKTPKNK
jgi:signal transduction histidine kinase